MLKNIYLILILFLTILPNSFADSCVANPPVYSTGKRIYMFYDSAGRYCKAFVDLASSERGYDIREIYDANNNLTSKTNFDLLNGGRLKFQVVYDINTKLPLQYVSWAYPNVDTVIQTVTNSSYVVISNSTTIKGTLTKFEEFTNGLLSATTLYSYQAAQNKISTVATTYNNNNRIVRTVVTTPYNKGETISNLDPGILDYLDTKIPVTLITNFDPISGAKKSIVQQIKSAAGKVSQYNVLDPLGQITTTLSRKYYDPILGNNFSNISVQNGPMRNGYSLTYIYNEEQIRKIRRQQLAAGEVYSDLGKRTNYISDWYNYPAPTASVPCPGSTSTERCLNVDLRDLFTKEMDLVARLSPARKKHVFAFIGDSITFQRTPGHPIAKDGDIYLNQGIPGEGTTQIYNRLNIINRSDVKLTAIFLMVGINNYASLFTGTASPTAQQVDSRSTEISINISTDVKQIQKYQPNAKIFVMSVTPVSIPTNVKWLRTEHINILNKKISDAIVSLPKGAGGLAYLDIASSLLDTTKNGDQKYFQADGLHLNLQGQSRTGQVIKQVIDSQFP